MPVAASCPVRCLIHLSRTVSEASTVLRDYDSLLVCIGELLGFGCARINHVQDLSCAMACWACRVVFINATLCDLAKPDIFENESCMQRKRMPT